MRWKHWLGLTALAGGLTLLVQPSAVAQLANTIVRIADVNGNRFTSSLEGSLRGLHVILVDPATNAAAVFGSTATQGGTIAADGPQVMTESTTALTGDTPAADNVPNRLKTDDLGRMLSLLGCPRQDRLIGYLANTDGASTALAGMGAQGANTYVEIWTLIVANMSATDISVDVRNGTGGSVAATLPAPATTDTGGGAVTNLNVPITISANTAAAVDGSGAVTTLYVTALGCKAK